jgi:hypothetical protein
MAKNPISYMPQQKTQKARHELISTDMSSKWITEPDKDQAAKNLYAYVNGLIRQQGGRLWSNTLFYSMYTNCDMLSGHSTNSTNLDMPRMTYNLVKTDTDVVAGTLVQSNSRAVIQTNEAVLDDWRRAEKMQLAIDGEWTRGAIYTEVQKVAIDALNTGSGWLKMYIDEDRHVAFNHTHANNVFVDEFECAYGPVRSIFEVRYVRKDVLAELHPEQADIIQSAAVGAPPKFGWTMYSPGMVLVIEGWAAPVGKRPGRHIVAVSSGAIVSEDWNERQFPLIQFRVGDKPLQPYGQGYTEQVFATQIYLNKVLTIMEAAAHLGIAPFWVLSEGSGVTADMMQNDTRIITSTDPAGVQYHYQPPFHADSYTYTRELERYIHNYYGINQLQANTTDSGLNRFDSSKAMNAYIDSSDTRHILLLTRWEQFFVEVAKKTILLAGQIAEKYGAYPVLAGGGVLGKMQQLDWKDIQMEEDSYRVTIAPANVLGSTPAARINDIINLRNEGILSGPQAARLAQGPNDIGAAVAEVNAVEDYIDFIISNMVEGKPYIGPTAIDDVPRMITRIADARCQFITRGLPQDRVRDFERWLNEANKIIQDAQQIQQLQQQLTQGGPAAQGTVQNASGSPASQPGAPSPSQPAAASPNPGPATGAAPTG